MGSHKTPVVLAQNELNWGFQLDSIQVFPGKYVYSHKSFITLRVNRQFSLFEIWKYTLF